MSVTDDRSKPIGIVYAQENPDGTFLFGVGPGDSELLRQGYGCSNCLEKFLVGGSLVQLPKCPTCGAEVRPDVAPIPEDWASYIAERQEALETPAEPRRASPRRR